MKKFIVVLLAGLTSVACTNSEYAGYTLSQTCKQVQHRAKNDEKVNVVLDMVLSGEDHIWLTAHEIAFYYPHGGEANCNGLRLEFCNVEYLYRYQEYWTVNAGRKKNKVSFNFPHDKSKLPPFTMEETKKIDMCFIFNLAAHKKWSRLFYQSLFNSNQELRFLAISILLDKKQYPAKLMRELCKKNMKKDGFSPEQIATFLADGNITKIVDENPVIKARPVEAARPAKEIKKSKNATK